MIAMTGYFKYQDKDFCTIDKPAYSRVSIIGRISELRNIDVPSILGRMFPECIAQSVIRRNTAGYRHFINSRILHCQRSFYVGEDIEQEDVKAEFKHGILKLFVPKKEAKKAVEENKYIAIEG
jgi:hypothetical protein